MDGRIRANAACGFFFIGPALFYGTLMARMPALKARAALSESEIGGLLLAPGISAVLMIAASSRLVARFGRRRDITDFVLLVLTPGSLTMQLRMRQKRGPKDVSSLRRLSGSSGSWRSALMQRKVHRPSGGALLLMTKGAGLDAAAPAFAAFAAAAALSAVSSASSCGGASQRVC